MAGLSSDSTSGLQLGPLTEADVEAAAALSASIGWNQDVADWRRLVALHPEGAVAARLAGELVGTATLIEFPGVEGGSLAWLGMVIASPALRGRGVGSAVTDAALRLWRPSPGDVIGLDATEFGAPLYKRRGFEAVATIDRWAGVLGRPGATRDAGSRNAGSRNAIVSSTTAKNAADIRVRRATTDDLNRISHLDQAQTRVDRSAVLRHLAAEESAAVFVAEMAGELLGYAVVRSGRVHRHVGPLVVATAVAVDPLLDRAAEETAGSTIFLDAVSGEVSAARLEAHGLKIARTLQRMTRPATPLDQGASVVAAMGFEWG